MVKEALLLMARSNQSWLEQFRRELHQHPETGFDLEYTLPRVRRELEALGCDPVDCGKGGLVVTIGGKHPGKTFLLRADMDALPMQEDADVPFASQTPGRMHGCGHDLHTAMLLGAAKLLKSCEAQLRGTVKLMFQPAEEIFRGAQDMIDAGVLENPKVDAAAMIHVTAGMPISSGILMLPAGGISAASCEQYHITVRGKGGHGSTPHLTIDPITAAAHIHLALQEINSRELKAGSHGVFTTGKFQAGQTSNVIPDTAEMWGTIRTVDPSGKIGQQIKTRMTEIAQGVGMAMRCSVEVEFFDFCPCMVVDDQLASDAAVYMTELMGPAAKVIHSTAGGSEDFAFVSHKVPSISMFLSAGNSKEGYAYAAHNPKVRFDDSILWRGSACYAYLAMRWLEEHP